MEGKERDGDRSVVERSQYQLRRRGERGREAGKTNSFRGRGSERERRKRKKKRNEKDKEKERRKEREGGLVRERYKEREGESR